MEFRPALVARAVTLAAQVVKDKFTWKDVLDALEAEFPGEPLPAPRTIREWRAVAPAVEPTKETLPPDEERKLRQLLKEKGDEIKRLTEQADFVANVTRSIEAHVSTAPAIIIPDARKHTAKRYTVQVIGNDWHFNERVNPARFVSFCPAEHPHMQEHFNEYDLVIAEFRIRTFFRECLKEMIGDRDPKRIERVIVPLIGDLNNGDIHAANVTNCTGSVEAAMLLADIVAQELLAYRKAMPWAMIDVIFKIGNHGRIDTHTKSPNAKLATENYDWVTGGVVKRMLQEQPNMTVENDPTLFSVREIYGQNHLYYHGHGIKGGGGISKLPLYSMAKFIYDQTIQFLRLNVPIHHLHIGHWHTHYEGEYGLGTIMMGRSLIGATERGSELGYSGQISQRIVWSTPEHPLGKRYPIDIPAKP